MVKFTVGSTAIGRAAFVKLVTRWVSFGAAKAPSALRAERKTRWDNGYEQILLHTTTTNDRETYDSSAAGFSVLAVSATPTGDIATYLNNTDADTPGLIEDIASICLTHNGYSDKKFYFKSSFVHSNGSALYISFPSILKNTDIMTGAAQAVQLMIRSIIANKRPEQMPRIMKILHSAGYEVDKMVTVGATPAAHHQGKFMWQIGYTHSNLTDDEGQKCRADIQKVVNAMVSVGAANAKLQRGQKKMIEAKDFEPLTFFTKV